MKKLCFWITNIVFSIVLSIGIFLCCDSQNTTSAAVTTTVSNSLLDNPGIIAVTQDGKIFDSEDDFSTSTYFNESKKTIYTNKNLNISFIHNFNVGLDHYQIFLNNSKIGDNNNSEEDFYRPYNQDGNTIPCYVFNTDNITEESVFIEIVCTIKTKKYYLDFVLVLTEKNFQTDENLYWEYKYNTITERVKAPTTGATYSPLSLHVPSGTLLNPTYIKFKYLGEEFLIYNIDGIFYNAFDDSELDIEYVLFDISGSYNVEIYDKTSLCYESSNHNQYNFIIKNTTTRNDSFYIHAHHESGALIANSQITNQDVIIDFVNLNDIIRSVDRIIVTKSWRPTGGENISEQTIYTTNIPSTLTISEDGTYNIRVIGKNGGNIIKEYEFILIKSIRNYFEMGNKVYEPDANEPANTYKTFEIETSFNSSYHDISGQTDYTFNVTIAKSAPNIEGINNNGRKQGSVALTIHGVGKIQVSITQDGNTTNMEVSNGTKLEKLTTPGKYYVKITDEMGTTVTKNFTITVKMNAAAKAIIIVGVILVAILTTFIIITRSKVKVK